MMALNYEGNVLAQVLVHMQRYQALDLFLSKLHAYLKTH